MENDPSHTLPMKRLVDRVDDGGNRTLLTNDRPSSLPFCSPELTDSDASSALSSSASEFELEPSFVRCRQPPQLHSNDRHTTQPYKLERTTAVDCSCIFDGEEYEGEGETTTHEYNQQKTSCHPQRSGPTDLGGVGDDYPDCRLLEKLCRKERQKRPRGVSKQRPGHERGGGCGRGRWRGCGRGGRRGGWRKGEDGAPKSFAEDNTSWKRICRVYCLMVLNMRPRSPACRGLNILWSQLHDREKKIFYTCKESTTSAILYVVEEGVLNNLANNYTQFGDTNSSQAKYLGRFVELLIYEGANVNITNRNGDTALHIAAERNLVPVVEVLLEHDAKIDTENNQHKLPLELALAAKNDSVAKRIVDKMHRTKVMQTFLAENNRPCRLSFHKLLDSAKTMQLTLQSVMKKMVSPAENNPDIQYKFHIEILQADGCGFQPTHKYFQDISALHHIVKSHNTRIFDNVIMQVLLHHKWTTLPGMIAKIHMAFFALFIVTLTFSLIDAAAATDPRNYSGHKEKFRAVCEIYSLVYVFIAWVAEVAQLFRAAKKGLLHYWLTCFACIEALAFTLLLLVVPLRFAEAQAQWIAACLGYLLACVRVFKFTGTSHVIGPYTQILARIILYDITRFTLVFLIILFTFSGSLMLALRSSKSSAHSNDTTQSDLFLFNETSSYGRIMISGVRIMLHGDPLIQYYSDKNNISWLAIIILLSFMFLVLIVLLNMLIAQLSDTYQSVQNAAYREVQYYRAYAIATIEHNFLNCFFWKPFRKWYMNQYRGVVVLDCHRSKGTPDCLQDWQPPDGDDLQQRVDRLIEQNNRMESLLLTLANDMSTVKIMNHRPDAAGAECQPCPVPEVNGQKLVEQAERAERSYKTEDGSIATWPPNERPYEQQTQC